MSAPDATERLRRQRAECQHGGIGLVAFLAVDQRDAVVFRYHGVDVERDDVDVMPMRLALLQCARDFRIEIVAVAAPRQKIGAGNRRIVALHEIQKAARPAGKHAHRRGPHIQQMAVRTGAVGDAARRRTGTAGVWVDRSRV